MCCSLLHCPAMLLPSSATLSLWLYAATGCLSHPRDLQGSYEGRSHSLCSLTPQLPFCPFHLSVMLLYLLLLGNGAQGLTEKGIVQALDEVKERSCCCLQEEWRRWSWTIRGAQEWDKRQQGHAGTWQHLTWCKGKAFLHREAVRAQNHPALSGAGWAALPT